ncbi:MAG: hypothetical protein Q8S21_03595 [Candidatus Paracaedibacteraceae bacterium]|nr:hypothetical protein [Candidatus Paracaedibacteraceae bacterium]
MKKLNTALLMTIFANTGFSIEPFPDETHEAAYQAHLAARYINRERYQAQYMPTHSSLPTTAPTESDEEMARRLHAEDNAEVPTDLETLALIAQLQAQNEHEDEQTDPATLALIAQLREQDERAIVEERDRAIEQNALYAASADYEEQDMNTNLNQVDLSAVDASIAQQLQEEVNDAPPIIHPADVHLALQLQEELNHQGPIAQNNTTPAAVNNYLQNYVSGRQTDPVIVQNAITALAPVMAAHDELIRILAPDSDIHAFDGFYRTYSAVILDQLRALRLGGDEHAAALTSEHALQAVQAMLDRPALEGQFDVNALRAHLPTFCNDFSEVDQELFNRMIHISFQLVANRANQVLTNLIRIPENWEQYGGCLQGRQDRNLLAIIRILSDLGLRQA